MVAKPDEVKQLATQAVTAGVMRVVATVVDPQAAAKRLVDDVRELPGKVVGRAAELPTKALGQLADLPKVAAGLPLKLALGAVATGEKVRNLLPGHGAASEATPEREAGTATAAAAPTGASTGAAGWDAAAPKPAPEDYTPPVAGGHTAQAAKVTRTELKAVPDTQLAAAAPARKAPAAKNPAAKTPLEATKAPTATTEAPAKVAAKAGPAGATDPISAATHDVLAQLADTLTEAASPSTDGMASVTPIHAGHDGHVDTELPRVVEAAIEAAPDGATIKADELPLAGYGSLSITQIRSRISKLDAVQLAQLRDYERAHADRAPVVTVLETKLKKLTGATAIGVDTASTVSSSAPSETAALIAEAPGNS